MIDDYVMREGTDYGHRDFDLEQKRDAVRRQLRSGRAVITYDPISQTTTIVPSPTARRADPSTLSRAFRRADALTRD